MSETRERWPEADGSRSLLSAEEAERRSRDLIDKARKKLAPNWSILEVSQPAPQIGSVRSVRSALYRLLDRESGRGKP